MMQPRIRVLSLGAGVQSTTLALMAAAGEIEAPDCAIFADTGWEPRAVYEHLDRLEAALPFPVHRVSKGNLRDQVGQHYDGQRFVRVDIPAFLVEQGKVIGLANRTCTKDYKVLPIAKKVRALLGYAGRKVPAGVQAEQWIGISLDEASRMKPSRNAWQVNRWPLIERRMSRSDCMGWLSRAGWAAPKSSCIGCPYHSNDQWRALPPEELADAVEVDRRLRDRPPEAYRLKGTMFLHRSGKPLDQVDLRTDEDRGQTNLFQNECEGMCGV